MMADWFTNTCFLYAAASLAGYLAGSLSFARIIFRIFSKSGELTTIEREIPDSDHVLTSDSRAATAVNLQLGKKYGCLTSLLDMAKAALITGLFRYLFPESNAFLPAAFFSMLGHVYPVFPRFKGGRGQSPLIGALLVINWFGVLIANAAAVILGYLSGSILVMRWGWMVLMIPWYALYFKDSWYVAYIFLSNLLFFFSMRRELSLSMKILQDRKSTQEEVSEFMLMGKGPGKFIDRYGIPAMVRKTFARKH